MTDSSQCVLVKLILSLHDYLVITCQVRPGRLQLLGKLILDKVAALL